MQKVKMAGINQDIKEREQERSEEEGRSNKSQKLLKATGIVG